MFNNYQVLFYQTNCFKLHFHQEFVITKFFNSIANKLQLWFNLKWMHRTRFKQNWVHEVVERIYRKRTRQQRLSLQHHHVSFIPHLRLSGIRRVLRGNSTLGTGLHNIALSLPLAKLIYHRQNEKTKSILSGTRPPVQLGNCASSLEIR